MKSANMAEYMATRRANRRQDLIEMSGGCCEVCNDDNELEFNHKDPSQKKFGLSGASLDRAWSKIVEEWEKCELLCKKHHLEHTQGLYDSDYIKSWNSNKHLPYIHGTMRAYQEDACRCELCRYAKKIYRTKTTTYNQVVQSSEVTAD